MKKTAWLLLFLAFFLLGICPLKDSDTFMYLALARDFFNNGHFPAQDPFILAAPGTEWRVVYEWGGFVIYYLGYLAAGLTGVILTKVALASVAWYPAVNLVWRWFQDSIVHFALFTIGLIAFSMRFSERTSLVADMLLMAAMSVVICDWKGWLRIRWVLPLIALVWINCHGSFPLVWITGLMWLGGWVVQGETRKAIARLPVFGLSLLTPLLNPEGWSGITYPFHFIEFKQQFLDHNTLEWMSPFNSRLLVFHEVYFFGAFLLLILLFLVQTARTQRSSKILPYLGLSLFFLLIGLSANRFISTSVLGLCLVSVTIPNPWRPRIPGEKWLMPLVSFALVVSLLTGVFVHTGTPHIVGTGVDHRMFPTKTVDVLKTLPERGPVWNSFYFGCYLAWELEQKKKIMIHGFVIDMGVFQRYYNGIGMNEARFNQITQLYNINEMLIQKDPKSLALFDVLTNHPDWKIAAQDEVSVLFEKR